jgi:hypothetical protein
MVLVYRRISHHTGTFEKHKDSSEADGHSHCTLLEIWCLRTLAPPTAGRRPAIKIMMVVSFMITKTGGNSGSLVL